MDEISWTDLNPAELYAIAALGAGISVEVCDSAALRTLKLAGLIRGTPLTPKAEYLRKEAASTLP
jgi:hypothetical protein